MGGTADAAINQNEPDRSSPSDSRSASPSAGPPIGPTANPAIDAAHRNVVFAAPPDDPRSRRPADTATFVLSSVVVMLCAWAYRSDIRVDEITARALADANIGWLDGVAVVLFAGGGVYTAGLVVGIAVFAKGRMPLVRDMVLAAILALVLGALVALVAASGQPNAIPELAGMPTPPPYPVARLAMMSAVLSAASPALAVPMRRVGAWAFFLAALSALFLDYGTVSGVIGGTMLGIGAAALVHMIFGSSLGVPSAARVRAAFADAGVDVDHIEFLARRQDGATPVRAVTTSREALYGRIYSRDASDAALLSRIWRWMWYRDSDASLFATGRSELAEHEALALLAAERGGAPTTPLACAGRSEIDDVLVATEWQSGTLLADMNDDDIDNELLASLWDALRGLRQAGIAHGNLSGSSIIITDDGDGPGRRAVLCHLEDAQLTPRPGAYTADTAQMVAVSAARVGTDRAVSAAVAADTRDHLVDAIAYIQPGNLSRATRSALHEGNVHPKDIRSALADRLGVEPPALAPIQRFSWKKAAVTALSAFACYNLVRSIAEIGFDTIADQMRNAHWGWVLVAFGAAQATNIGKTVALSAQVGVRLPLGPSILFRWALSFMGIAVPGGAGSLALNVRFLQRFGVQPAAAVAVGPLNTAVSKTVDVFLLLISIGAVSATVDWGDVQLGSGAQLGGAVVIAAVVSVIVLLAVPKFRHAIIPQVKIGWNAVKSALVDPHRLASMFAGTLLSKVLFAVAVAASTAAYGNGISLPEAIFVNTAVSVLVGLIPVPGGVGVGETALTSGLMAVGVPKEAAAAAAITHRVVADYLPVVLGGFASRWLSRHSYI